MAHGHIQRLAAGLAIGAAVAAGGAATALAQVNVGLIEIEEGVGERPGPMDWLLGDTTVTMRDVLAKIAEVEGDEDIDALVVRLRDPRLTVTQVEELGRGLEALRAKGKKVHVFAEAYSTPELMLAAHADEVILQTGGVVSLPGLYMEEMYLADTLAWAGVKADFVQVGDYKGAAEAVVNSKPSPQWEENISGLLDSLYENIRATIKAGRKLDDARLDEAMRRAWMADGETAIEVGLIDATADLPDLTDHLETAYDDEIEWTNLIEADEGKQEMASGNPFQILQKLSKEPKNRPARDTIAVVHIDGPIVDGESASGGFMGEASVGSTTIRRALSEIEDDDQVRAVILRINSPGGSAIASEIIWQGVRRIAEDKPVWVSVGSMAASGGYYIAVSGEKIYVAPSSIVGSIGVVGGKLALAGLYDKLKINAVGRSRGPLGGIFGSSEPWTEQERGLVREKMTETYELFASRVKQGREAIDLSKTAEGRLFAGQRAVELKMADKVGGLEVAIEDLAGELGLEAGAYDVLDYPAPAGFADFLENLFGSFGASTGARHAAGPGGDLPGALASGMLRELVGERAWPGVRDNLAAMMQLREEPVLLVSPRAIIVK